jgi:nucleoside-diphosphate-sugar epimerase
MPPIRLEKRGRVALDRAVLEAADTGIVASVICPTMIYGPGLGLKPESAQVPMLITAARRRRGAAVVGRGLNRWANVHIEDLCELYRLLATGAVPRGFYFAENGEAALIDIARSINASLHTSDEPTSLSIRESIALWGPESASFALGSNSRVRRAKRQGSFMAAKARFAIRGCRTPQSGLSAAPTIGGYWWVCITAPHAATLRAGRLRYSPFAVALTFAST